MKTKILFSAILAMLFLLLPCAFAQRAGLGPGSLVRFQKALDRDGFEVSAGSTQIMDWAEEYCQGNLDNAGYVNKAPYLRFLVPTSAQDSTLTEVFQLRPDEAIVLIGLTPPPVNYFGYYTFLWTKVFPDVGRQPMFATLGDTVNNLTVKTIGPTPYNRPVVLIFTPDQGTDARVRAALRRAGYPAQIINTLVFPAPMLNLGHGDAADVLRIGMRLGVWKNPEAGDAFLQHAPETLKVFRVTPRTPATANPFPVPPLRVRGTGHTEMDLMNAQGRLRQGIIAANPGLYATEIPRRPNWYEGYDYIQRGVNPGGDVRDAFLLSAGWLPEYGSTDQITLADDEFLMVYGANHVATGKATYMSVNVYASKTAKLSIGQVFQKDHFADTATPYLPPGDVAAKLMYVYKVSRDCGGEPNCLQLGIDYECPPLTIDSSTILGIIFRMYLEPSTKVGPAMPEILYDRVLKFSPRPPAN